MKTETITNRIDRNITDLLVNMSVSDCIENLNNIQERFSSRLEKVENNLTEILKIQDSRTRYTNIYVYHTKKRIKDLSKIVRKEEFRQILFKENLQNEKHIPNYYSTKYKLIALSES